MNLNFIIQCSHPVFKVFGVTFENVFLSSGSSVAFSWVEWHKTVFSVGSLLFQWSLSVSSGFLRVLWWFFWFFCFFCCFSYLIGPPFWICTFFVIAHIWIFIAVFVLGAGRYNPNRRKAPRRNYTCALGGRQAVELDCYLCRSSRLQQNRGLLPTQAQQRRRQRNWKRLSTFVWLTKIFQPLAFEIQGGVGSSTSTFLINHCKNCARLTGKTELGQFSSKDFRNPGRQCSQCTWNGFGTMTTFTTGRTLLFVICV